MEERERDGKGVFLSREARGAKPTLAVGGK